MTVRHSNPNYGSIGTDIFPKLVGKFPVQIILQYHGKKVSRPNRNVRFVAERSLLEAVASSLTELFSPIIIGDRVSGMLANL